MSKYDSITLKESSMFSTGNKRMEKNDTPRDKKKYIPSMT